MKNHGREERKTVKTWTIHDVAELAQVSIGSVSRVLNENKSVKPATRIKVQRAIEQLGYQPNLAARTIRGNITKTIACILRDVEVAGFGQFIRAADLVFSQAGYALLLCNTEGNRKRERELISLVSARRSDAILIAHSTEEDAELQDSLKNTNVPVVLVDREVPHWADAVLVDHRGAVRTATEKLIQLGHSRIALLTGHSSLYPGRERRLGFEEAHRNLGVKFDAALCRQGNFEAEFAFEQTSLLAASKHRPTAIVAGGIDMLPGVLRALRVLKLSIPKDISVIGAYNSDLAELHSPSISVEAWDYAAVGKIAANLVLSRLQGVADTAERRILVPADFVMRESVSASPRT